MRPPEISGLITHPAEDPQDNLSYMREVEFPSFVSLNGLENEQALHPFFESIRKIESQNSQVRILYYGDSQLEGDRITSYFRRRLQGIYGGSGPGIISLASPEYGSLTVSYSQSSNWVTGSRTGSMLGYSSYTGDAASIKLSAAGGLAFDSFRLFVYQGHNEGIVNFSSNGGAGGIWHAKPENEWLQLHHTFPSVKHELSLEFEGMADALFMGLSLESSCGVIVDNIARRGSAGLEFTDDRTGFFRDMASKLDPDLIILQFGINVVPADTRNFDYYYQSLKTQIQYLHEQLPEIPVIIVGVSDMGRLLDGVPVPYQTVAEVSSAQRRAAGDTGAVFFDLLGFMGGPGSFKTWMEADPVLMRRDFTHFTYAGGKLVAEGLAHALVRGCDDYLNQGKDVE